MCPAIGGCWQPSLPERNEEALPISLNRWMCSFGTLGLL
uniref:Uncharacterized protein n=1 Tax=Utricularia reniformis TaxID=192314 RepID=A0A1Y0B4K3_9LAMI|nr:hypothetical protein AEK19_MT2205 [Utricularia reniformis]ART32351.1 hypothetical protein AEK19_MT2205 [Utricularia reniformis]